MAYTRFDPVKADFLAAAIKYHGNISALSKHYKIAKDTMYQYLYRDPVGKEILDTVRGLNTETDLDLAEHVMRFNLTNYQQNAAIAQRAAEFVIERKGTSRGWEKVSTGTTQEDKERVSSVCSIISSLQDALSRSSSADTSP